MSVRRGRIVGQPGARAGAAAGEGRWPAAMALVLLALLASPIRAEDFTVDTNADGGAGSLRQAVVDANAATDPSNQILFSGLSDPTTITLQTPLPKRHNRHNPLMTRVSVGVQTGTQTSNMPV